MNPVALLNSPTGTSKTTWSRGTASSEVRTWGLHYLDFGGDGLPILLTAGSRSAETWAGFAPRFTNRHRVLAITLVEAHMRRWLAELEESREARGTGARR
jgi:hypothetical protein